MNYEEGKRSSEELQKEIARPSLSYNESDSKKYQLTVRLSGELLKFIEFEAERCGISLAEVVRRLLDKAIQEGDW